MHWMAHGVQMRRPNRAMGESDNGAMWVASRVSQGDGLIGGKGTNGARNEAAARGGDRVKNCLRRILMKLGQLGVGSSNGDGLRLVEGLRRVVEMVGLRN